MVAVAPHTAGVISDPRDIARLLQGCCVLCARAHSGFGREQRAGLWLAACGCGAIYEYRDEPSAPRSINWYRTRVR